jgi:2-hydroxychromene-2-carboxylate isomerase
MDRPNTILVYSDYKSPYAFLAKDLIYELEDQFDVHLEWLPYTLDIPSYLGSARVDERGEVVESTRNATSGAECATRTWTAGDKPANAAS